MSERFPEGPAPPRPHPPRPGRVLPFRLPFSRVLSRPLLRWSAMTAVVLLGLLLVALSLKPGWFFPESTPPAAPSAAAGETGGGVAPSPFLDWHPVEGAALYRLSFLDPETGRLVLSMTTRETSLELPSEAAARLAPAATCELVIEALSGSEEVLSRESRLFEPPRAVPGDDAD